MNQFFGYANHVTHIMSWIMLEEMADMEGEEDGDEQYDQDRGVYCSD